MRNNRIEFKVTASEYKIIRAAATSAGMTVSGWVRFVLIEYAKAQLVRAKKENR